MNKQTVKAIGGAAFVILLLVTIAQIGVSAPANGDGERTLVGSWNILVTLRDCQSGVPIVTFPAMETYSQGGTLQQTAPPAPGATFLPGHGVWSHQAGGGYSAAFQFFSITPAGFVDTKTIVRSTISLGPDGKSYNSTETSETFDTNGNLLLSGCSTSTATRFE